MTKDILESILDIVGKMCFEKVSGESNLFDIGLNSLNAIELIVTIERKFNIKFDDSELALTNMETPNKLAELVKAKIISSQRSNLDEN